MSKVGLHDPFGHMKHKLWSKEKLRVKLTIGLLTTKSDTLPSPRVNPLEGSPKCSCGKLGFGRAFPTSSTIKG